MLGNRCCPLVVHIHSYAGREYSFLVSEISIRERMNTCNIISIFRFRHSHPIEE